ncbi:hypothetical protein K1719_042173 [Acacia pycnantha]|nr:hypothetical protein K1719_042173 [Acacia pycnantha]
MKLLREAGVPESNVIKLLQLYPRAFTKSTDRFKMIVKELQEMGFGPSKSPFCMKVSEDKIDAIMDILVDKLGCPPSTIPQYAVVLSLSTDKRIIPRAAVLQVLLSKGLVRKKSLLSMFVFSFH